MSMTWSGTNACARSPRRVARAERTAWLALTARPPASPRTAGSPAAEYQARAANCRCAAASRSDSSRAREPTRTGSAAGARRRCHRHGHLHPLSEADARLTDPGSANGTEQHKREEVAAGDDDEPRRDQEAVRRDPGADPAKQQAKNRVDDLVGGPDDRRRQVAS